MSDNFAGLSGGLSVAVLGPPGTGKSTLAGSCGALGPTKLLATKPREANSWLYRKHGISAEAEIFHDPKWRPSAGMFEASGYCRLIERLWQLYDDDHYEFVVCDPYTDVVSLAANELLRVTKSATPRDTVDSMGFYGSLKYKLKEVTQALTALQFAPRPKHVIVTAHTMPAKDDRVGKGGVVIESSDNRAMGVEFEGTVLPMIEGSYRREFTGEFDIVVYSDIQLTRKLDKGKVVESSEYVIQVAPDTERHSKTVLGPVFTEKNLPNDFAVLLAAVQKGVS